MQTLFLAWQDPENKKVFPIGRLTSLDKCYQFNYTKGALIAKKESHFHELASFPSLEKVYTSQELFPLFSNRLLPRSRPEYKDFIKWMSIAQGEDNPMALLARSGGKRMTDSLEVFSYPEVDEKGNYYIYFFAQGMNSLPKDSVKRVEELFVGEQLLLVNDVQSFEDKKIVLLKTTGCSARKSQEIGYLPGLLTENLTEILNQDNLQITVERINLSPAPIQFRLLCKMTFTQQTNFHPFTKEMYQPISLEI